MTEPIGPTEHLHTVKYWRDLYSDAVQVGQEMLDKERAEAKRLRALLSAHGIDPDLAALGPEGTP